MKQVIQQEISVCDVCTTGRACYEPCIECGKEVCYDCKKIHGKTYHAGVSWSGSGDGYYCAECDASMRANGDKRHRAYRAIESLRAEAEGFYSSFKTRTAEAELEVKQLGRT
jgi:hypothetical protein